MQPLYDEVAYPSISHVQTHPDRLATLALLFGLEPAPVQQCRVLEIGCAGGGNLIPMAYALPSSQFIGIDLSPKQVAMARFHANVLGLSNVTFEAMDLMQVTPDYGRFDYIIAHGIYSWVPREVQHKVLDICREHLAPNGVAYISYNTYPGWHQMNAIRDVMRYHTREVDDPSERVTYARGMLHFLAHAHSMPETPYGTFLKAYDAFLNEGMQAPGPQGDALLLHNELGDINEPLYFYQFVEQAAEHGLQYLVEADFASVTPENVAPEDRPVLLRMARDIIDLEQYLDFVHNRSFRRTLLCHQEVNVERALNPRALSQLHVASRASVEAGEEGANERFMGSDGAVLETDHPLVRTALHYLIESWPRRVHFRDLVYHCVAHLESTAGQEFSPDDIRREAFALGGVLLKAYSRSPHLVTLHTYDPPFTTEPGDRPLAIDVARLQARGGRVVTNVRHERVVLNPLQHHLLPLLDGTHTRETLMDELVLSGAAEGLTDGPEAERDEENGPAEDRLRRLLDEQLQALAHSALLVS